MIIKKLASFTTLFMLPFMLFSQRIPKAYQAYFTNCCENIDTKIEFLLDINGYFIIQSIYYRETNKPDTSFEHVIFYKDGLCAIWHAYKNQPSDSFLADVIRKGPKHYFYRQIQWGKYKITGDTLVLRSIKRGTFMQPEAEINEIAFKITNQQNMTLVCFKSLNTKDTPDNAWYDRTKFLPVLFKPCMPLPPSEYSWIKKQKCKSCKGVSK